MENRTWADNVPRHTGTSQDIAKEKRERNSHPQENTGSLRARTVFCNLLYPCA